MRVNELLHEGILDETQQAALNLPPSQTVLSVENPLEVLRQVDEAQERIVAEAAIGFTMDQSDSITLKAIQEVLALKDVLKGLATVSELPSPVPDLAEYRAEDWE